MKSQAIVLFCPALDMTHPFTQHIYTAYAACQSLGSHLVYLINNHSVSKPR